MNPDPLWIIPLHYRREPCGVPCAVCGLLAKAVLVHARNRHIVHANKLRDCVLPNPRNVTAEVRKFVTAFCEAT